jgi:hypothetical protein
MKTCVVLLLFYMDFKLNYEGVIIGFSMQHFID